MAYITGQTSQGCCLPVKYLGDQVYECAPDVGELHLKHRIYNDYHMWYAKIMGSVGEKITIHLKWPQYDPDLVSEEYKSWDSYCTDWPSFFETIPEVLYYSTDQIHWTRLEEAYIEGDTVIFSLELAAEESYISSILHYTQANYENLIAETVKSPYVQMMSLGKCWDGSELMTFVATDFTVPAAEKKTIYLQALQHCHEHPGGHVCDFVLRCLANPDEQVKQILKECIFRVTPVVDMTGWKLGRQSNPGRVTSLDFNYNRDWGIFKLPETRAIAAYLTSLKEQGEQFVFLADIHGGTGDEDDYSSGASIAFDDRADQEVLDSQADFVNMVRQQCDYLNPADSYFPGGRRNDAMFTVYVNKHFGPGYTFEVSMSKIWDRAADRRFPNSQEAFKRFGQQLVHVLGEHAKKAVTQKYD